MIPNAPHQKLVDGLNVLVLHEFMSQEQAWDIIRSLEGQPDEIDEAVLFQIRKDYGLE
jgi:hypothetical protein